MRAKFRDWAYSLHQRTPVDGFVHNCVAHPLWWAGERLLDGQERRAVGVRFYRRSDWAFLAFLAVVVLLVVWALA